MGQTEYSSRAEVSPNPGALEAGKQGGDPPQKTQGYVRPQETGGVTFPVLIEFPGLLR